MLNVKVRVCGFIRADPLDRKVRTDKHNVSDINPALFPYLEIPLASEPLGIESIALSLASCAALS